MNTAMNIAMNIAVDTDGSAIICLEEILEQAIQQEASDIHIEPLDLNLIRIRTRQDGVLYSLKILESVLGQKVISRIKVLSGLNIAEKRLPQDGSFSVSLKNNPTVDIRVSTCPMKYGEKIVLRLQWAASHSLPLDQLGFEPENLDVFYKALRNSQGIIFVTGPTGSGKTLTLYSALKKLNQASHNICTVEDPIEMPLEGVCQVQIQPKINLTFSAVLSAFLRQDPDIMMVGEIRDLETAEIAVKAAHTGHLVLATLHTNNALETLTRLAGMGIQRYAIASAINLMLAQRLVRKLCLFCREKISADLNPEKFLDLKEKLLALGMHNIPDVLFVENKQGCEKCYSGFKGQTGCFEVVPITEDLKNLILNHASVLDMQKYCDSQGYLNLFRAGIQKVFRGETTLDEVLKM